MTDALKPLVTIQSKLIKAGATLPPPLEGTIESAITRGLSIALLLVQEEIEKIIGEEK